MIGGILSVLIVVVAANDVMVPDVRLDLTNSLSSSLSAPACGLVEIVAAQVPSNPSFDVWNFTQAACSATFTDPTGNSFVRDAFYTQNYTRSTPGQWDQLNPAGSPVYLVRFAAIQQGDWKWSVSCLNGSVSSSGTLTVGPESPDNPCEGFVRVSKTDKYSFAWSETGRRMIPIGEDNCWGNQQNYEKWFGSLTQFNANYSRIWLGFNSPFRMMTIQAGLGKFDQEAAWRTDALLSIAKSMSMRLMLSLYSYNILRPDHKWNGCWSDCSVIVKDLGLTQPMQYFTDPRARLIQDRYHRYIVARYGWSPHLFSYEQWNEVDGAEDYDVGTVAQWSQWFSDTVRVYDSYAQHPITTSFAQHPGAPTIDGTSAMDYSQTHVYSVNDFADAVTQFDTQKAIAYGKPSYIGEMGFSDPSTSQYDDPTGINLLNGLIAPLFAIGGGGSSTWWWDNWVDPQNLYFRWQTPGIAYDLAYRLMVSDLTQWNITTATAPNAPSNLELLAVANAGRTRAMIWVRNTEVNWKSALQRNQQPPPALPALNVSLPSMSGSSFPMTMLAVNSTFDPGLNKTGTVSPNSDQSITISVPSNRWGAMLFIGPMA